MHNKRSADDDDDDCGPAGRVICCGRSVGLGQQAAGRPGGRVVSGRTDPMDSAHQSTYHADTTRPTTTNGLSRVSDSSLNALSRSDDDTRRLGGGVNRLPYQCLHGHPWVSRVLYKTDDNFLGNRPLQLRPVISQY